MYVGFRIILDFMQNKIFAANASFSVWRPRTESRNFVQSSKNAAD